MVTPPGIARELDTIGRLARELETSLVALREQMREYVAAERERGNSEVPEAEIWRQRARDHIRFRPVLRSVLK